MDIKQAIEFGENRADLFGGKMEEFIKLSLEALKKQDKEQDDLIDRKALIDFLKHVRNNLNPEHYNSFIELHTRDLMLFNFIQILENWGSEVTE